MMPRPWMNNASIGLFSQLPDGTLPVPQRPITWPAAGSAIAMPQDPGSLDRDGLAAKLAALAYPLRLELLEALEKPATLTEIRVHPLKATSGSPERHAAKQTVAAHLDRLVDVGLVIRTDTETHGKAPPTYAVNPQAIYALTEDIGRLSRRHSGRGRGLDWTGTVVAQPSPERAAGARLVLVHGAYEGRTYPLGPVLDDRGEWLIGRARGLHVSLDYDPFVSLENAIVTWQGGTYRVTDLPASKNGTSVNWEPLPRGGSRALAAGDVIGVGRSLLVLQTG